MPRMSEIEASQAAREASIERMLARAKVKSELELNHGARSAAAVNDHLRRQPLGTIDRDGLVDAALKAFGVSPKK